MIDPWIAFRKPNPAAKLRLFCFPYAGGSALVFRSWVTGLPSQIDVIPVQLPGRGQRLKERPYANVAPLVDDLGVALAPYFDRPFAFFGHSMGAVIAYELTQWLRKKGSSLPVHLLVSGRRAPQLPPVREPYHLLSDADLLATLRGMNGTPEEVLANDELMNLMLPMIRADFAVAETYKPTHHLPLACPITALGGRADPEVDPKDLELWRECSSGGFRLRIFPGDHFYLHQGEGKLLAAVSEELTSATGHQGPRMNQASMIES